MNEKYSYRYGIKGSSKILGGIGLVACLNLGGAGEIPVLASMIATSNLKGTGESNARIPTLGQAVSLRGGDSIQSSMWLVAEKTIKNGEESSSVEHRDPFVPLEASRPAQKPKLSLKPKDPVLSKVSPPGRLLSVAHGPWGYQAVIQVSPKENIVVEPGDLLTRSGWWVKNIHEDRVVLVYGKKISSSIPSSSPQTAVLNFP